MILITKAGTDSQDMNFDGSANKMKKEEAEAGPHAGSPAPEVISSDTNEDAPAAV